MNIKIKNMMRKYKWMILNLISPINVADNELSILDGIDLSLPMKNKNICINHDTKIAFVIPGMNAFSGGHTSILRLGTYLIKAGYNVEYITYGNYTVEEMKRNARINLPLYRGEFYDATALENKTFDIIIATWWVSCYWIYKYQKNYKAIAYFIQDFEPCFYPYGDRYFCALNTYKLGFKMISLGRWNEKQIRKYVASASIKSIEFPFECQQYEISRIKNINAKNVRICVYVKPEEKRGMYILNESLKVLNKLAVERKINLQILIYGLEKRYKFSVGINLGKLKTNELIELYRSCDIGVVASYTNVSLVPFEMIACGIPVVDFMDGSAPCFFPEKSMIFVESSPYDFSHKILYYIMHPKELREIAENGQKHIKEKTWEKTSQQFVEMLRELVQ